MISIPLHQRRAARREREVETISGLLALGYGEDVVMRWLRSNRISVSQPHIRGLFRARGDLWRRIDRTRLELEAAVRRAEKDRARADTSAVIVERLRASLAEMESKL